MPQIIKNGPNIKIVAALSYALFSKQNNEYKLSIMKDEDWLNCMIITNTSLNNMSNWIKHDIVRKYSISPDWDNRWRCGGNLEEIIDESHLSSKWQMRKILEFATDYKRRINYLNATISNIES